MKKILFTSIIVILIINLCSCRKGEHDPFLSLLPRKTRLCGEWKVTNETYKRNYHSDPYGPDNYTYYNNYTYDGNVKIGSHSGSGWNIPDSVEYYKEVYTFKKDYTFQFEHLNEEGSSIVYNGSWVFLKATKDYYGNSLKNKEAIELNITNYVKTDINGNTYLNIPSNFSSKIVFKIDRLKNNEIILIKQIITGSGPTGGFNTYWEDNETTTTTLKKNEK